MLLCAVSFTIIRARPACANWSAKLPRSPAKPPGVSSAMDTSPNRSIELPSYTESEKLQIAKRYLVPRQLEEHGLSRQELKLPDATLRRVIHDYTREAGVRQLEREIAALTRKATRRIVSNGHIPKPIYRAAQLHRVGKTSDSQTLLSAAPTRRARFITAGAQTPRCYFAPCHSRLYARGRRAPIGARNCRAHPQSHPAYRQQWTHPQTDLSSCPATPSRKNFR